jgi:sugar phosphate permease
MARCIFRWEARTLLSLRPSSSQANVPFLWPFKRAFYGWGIVSVSMLVTFAHAPMYGPMLAIFVKPIGDDLGWSRTTIALAFTIGSFSGSMLSGVVGGLFDRYGGRGIIALSGMVVAGAMLGLAVMTDPWHFWALIGVGRGVAIAGINLGTSVMIAKWFIRMRGRAMAIGGSGVRIGQAALPFLAHAIIVTQGWRSAYVVLAVLTALLVTIPALIYMRRKPEDLGLLPDGDDPNADPNDARMEGRRQLRLEEAWTLKEAIREPSLWLVVLVLAAGAFALTAVNLHLTASFQDRGISAVLAVTVTAIYTGVSAVSMIVWGFAIERIHARYLTMAVSLIYIVSMVVMLQANTFPVALAFVLMFGVATGGWTVLHNVLIADYFGRHSVGAIRGFTMPFTGFINPLGPLLAGWLRDTHGDYNMAFIIFIGVFVLMFVSMLLAVPPRRKVTPEAV